MVYVNDGVVNLISYFRNTSPTPPGYIGVGGSNTAPAVTDSALGTEVYRAAIDTTNYDSSSVTFTLLIPSTDLNGVGLKEFGLFNAASTQIDDCETADWSDSADMTTSLNATTFIENLNSLNLIKDGTATTTASTSKATSSVDFTSKQLYLFLYIKDATAYAKLATSACLTVRFGSDSSNYYQWTKDKADIAVGWNIISGFTSANATATGTPVITACDYTYVGLTATGAAITWSAGDFMMDDINIGGPTMFSRSINTVIDKTSVIEVEYSIKVNVLNS